MAEEQELDLDLEGEKGKSNTKLIIMIAGGALLLIGVTVGIMLFVLGGDDEEATEAEAVAESETQKMQYLDMKPAFTVTASKGGRARLLQVHMSVATRDDEIFDAVRIHMPLIRHSITALLSSQDFDALRTAEGKEKLRADAIAEVQRIVNEEAGLAEGVENVLFTNLVMQ